MKRAVDYLAADELPIYDKPEGQTTFAVGEKGQNIIAIEKPRRVIIPWWPVKAKTTINPDKPEGIKAAARELFACFANYIGIRIHEVVRCFEDPTLEADTDGPDWTLLVVVKQIPKVYFVEAEDMSGDLIMGLGAVIGIGTVADGIKRTEVDPLPVEVAKAADLVVPEPRGRLLDFAVQQRFAEDLQKQVRASLFG